jgi:glycosyltransferase involved in cell wall biosynthesis
MDGVNYSGMKTLTLVAELGRPDRREQLRRELEDEGPRGLLFEDSLNSDMLDGGVRRRLARYLGQVLDAYRRRRGYDAVLTWGEPLSLLFALLLKLTGSRTRHLALMYWVSPRGKALFLKAVHSHIDQIITWSSVQREVAIERLGIPATKITLVRHPVDQRFWRPMGAATDTICAAGNEMRDYTTLITAMRDLTIPCEIAVRNDPSCTSRRLTTMDTILRNGSLPANVTLGSHNYPELRALYARSRFVVIPLLPTDTDNGIRVALEAMAMGKAVICSRTRGQVDVIEEGKTGLFVPPRDPRALGQAIQYLWDHPEVADRMGMAGRQRIEQRHTLDQFVNSVKGIVEQVIAEPRLAPV